MPPESSEGRGQRASTSRRRPARTDEPAEPAKVQAPEPNLAGPPAQETWSVESAQPGAPASGGGLPPPFGGGQPPPPPGPQSPSADASEDDGDDPRRVAHELIGQAHAVLVVAVGDSVLPIWCPVHLRQSFLDARAEWWEAVGTIQASIASGTHDERLRADGIGGAVSRHKRKGLRYAVQRLIAAVTPGTGGGASVSSDASYRTRNWMKTAASLARTAVGSLARELPGGEIIAEALDGVISAVDTPQD